MHDKLKELLKKIGVAEATIKLFTDEEKKEELEALKVEDAVVAVQKVYEGKLENDAAFVGKIQNEVRGKVLGSKQRLIQKLVPELTKDEIDALPEKSRFDDMLELAVKKVVERNGGSKKDENEQLREAKAAAKQWEDKYKKLEEEEIPKLKQSHQSQLDDRDISSSIRSHIESKKDAQGKPLVIGKTDFLTKSTLSHLKEQYVTKIVDGKVKYFQHPKEGHEGDLLAAYDGNEELTFEKGIDNFLQSNNLIRQSNAEPGGGGGDTDPAPASQYNLPGLAAAQAKVEG